MEVANSIWVKEILDPGTFVKNINFFKLFVLYFCFISTKIQFNLSILQQDC